MAFSKGFRRFGRFRFRRRRFGRRRFSRFSRRKTFLPRNRNSRYARLSKQVINRNGHIPDVTYVKLKYSEIFDVAGVSGSLIYSHIFSGNSIVVPSAAVPQHKAYAVEQWANFYGKYTVLGSAIRVSVIPTTDTSPAMRFYLIPHLTPTPLTGTIGKATALAQYPRARHRIVTFNSNTPAYISHYTRTGTVYGQPQKVILTDPAYSATFTTSPTNGTHWQLFYHQVSPTSTSAIDLHVDVSITYYVRLWQRIPFSFGSETTAGLLSSSAASSVSSDSKEVKV